MLQPDQHQELLDSVVEEFTERLRRGQRPAIQEYAQKYPSLSDDIEELLTSVAMIEELKTQSGTSSGTLKREMKEILQLDRIGDYRIIRELGRGGMGIVFEAVHESLGRRVAIKVMPNRTFDDQKYLERFKREAQAAASLHHTNIVSVFGIGQTGEHHYYVMEFVDGKSLSKILSQLKCMNESRTQDERSSETIPAREESSARQGNSKATVNSEHFRVSELFDNPKQRFRWAAEVGMQMADGLAYAHGLGTLHRDIKPSNLLVDKNERVWLTDFGLVKHISNQTITKTGDIVGTPQYMAPESFEGKYDERSETYCLGLSLYEIVTLRPAYENASTPELIRRITTTRPIPPRKIDSRVPRDLNRIIQKATSREPAYRYQLAEEMRDDLRAFLEDRPISARKISMTENIWRWSIRNPLSASLALVTALMICAIAVGATVALRMTNQALADSQEQTNLAQHQKRLSVYMKDKAEETTIFTVEAFDEMFRGLVFRGSPGNKDFALDGFNSFEGVSNTITESDAEFLDKMLHFYIDFANQNKDNLLLQSSTAKSKRRVANIYHLSGKFDDAIEAYKESIEIHHSIRATSPDSIPLALELAKTTNELGRAIELQGLPQARKHALKQFAAAEEMLRNHVHSENGLIQMELAKTLILAGSPVISYRAHLPERFEGIREWTPKGWFAQAAAGGIGLRTTFRVLDPNRSIKTLKQASRIAGKLVGTYPVPEEAKFVKAMALTRLATIQIKSRDFHSGRKSLQSAEKLLVELKKQQPDNPEYQFVLAQIYSMPKRNNTKSQISSLTKSRKLLESLSSSYVGNLDYKRAFADCCFRLGIACLENKNNEAALSNLSAANDAFRDLVPLTPRNSNIQANGIVCLLQLADLQLESGEYDTAVANIEKALDDIEKNRLSQKGRAVKYLFVRKSICLNFALAIIHREEGNFQEALAARQRMLYYLELSPRLKRTQRTRANSVGIR